MILEAASDIRDAERDLREIEILKSRQVEGSGELERESFLFFFLFSSCCYEPRRCWSFQSHF